MRKILFVGIAILSGAVPAFAQHDSNTDEAVNEIVAASQQPTMYSPFNELNSLRSDITFLIPQVAYVGRTGPDVLSDKMACMLIGRIQGKILDLGTAHLFLVGDHRLDSLGTQLLNISNDSSMDATKFCNGDSAGYTNLSDRSINRVALKKWADSLIVALNQAQTTASSIK